MKLTNDQIIAKALDILESRLHKAKVFLENMDDAQTYLKLKYGASTEEFFGIMFLDKQYGLLAIEEIARGTVDEVKLYPREIIKAALAHPTAGVVLFHNHPSGNYNVSVSDIIITRRLADMFISLDIELIDHLIVAGNKVLSFGKEGIDIDMDISNMESGDSIMK